VRIRRKSTSGLEPLNRRSRGNEALILLGLKPLSLLTSAPTDRRFIGRSRDRIELPVLSHTRHPQHSSPARPGVAASSSVRVFRAFLGSLNFLDPAGPQSRARTNRQTRQPRENGANRRARTRKRSSTRANRDHRDGNSCRADPGRTLASQTGSNLLSPFPPFSPVGLLRTSGLGVRHSPFVTRHLQGPALPFRNILLALHWGA